MIAPPDTLLVEADLDGLSVTLGPSGRLLARGGPVGATMASGVGLALGTLGQPVPGALIAVLGCVLGSAMRVRGWVRAEAPLQIRLSASSLELRRVYRARLLYAEVVPLDALAACAATGRGVRLTWRDGRSRELVAGFRSPDELRWVAALIDGRLQDRSGAVDDRLVALRVREA